MVLATSSPLRNTCPSFPRLLVDAGLPKPVSPWGSCRQHRIIEASFKGGESSADTRLLAGGHRTVDSSWVVHVLSDSEDIERCNSLCDSAQQRMCLMGLTSLQH